jgi:hypothetical protein
MAPIYQKDDRERRQVDSTSQGKEEAGRRSGLRRQLASLSFAQAQALLSPGRATGLDELDLGGSTDRWPEADPTDLEALTYEGQGGWWAGVGLDAYEGDPDAVDGSDAHDWETGRIVSSLTGHEITGVGGQPVHITLGSAEVDAQMGTGGAQLTGREDSSISSGVLRIDRDVLTVFHEGSPHISDVLQGGTGDCYLLAALVGMANTAPGRARIQRMVRSSGGGYTVDFAGLEESASGDLHAVQGARVRVHVSGLKSSQGVDLAQMGPSLLRLDEAQEKALISQHGGRPEKKGGGWTGRVGGFFRGMFSRVKGVHTVEVFETTMVLWPWIIEKAFAIIGGGYSAVGKGGASIIPTLALMGSDSTAYFTEITSGGEVVEDMNAKEAALAFETVQARVMGGGVSTVGTRTHVEMRDRGPIDDTWRVRTADHLGIRLDASNYDLWSWESLGGRLNPYIQVETEEGGLYSVDPRAISRRDRQMIISAVEDLRVVEVHAKNFLQDDGLKLVPNHAYTVLAARPDGLELHNPWGYCHPGRPVRPDEFAYYFTNLYLSDIGAAPSPEEGIW